MLSMYDPKAIVPNISTVGLSKAYKKVAHPLHSLRLAYLASALPHPKMTQLS